VQLTKSSVVKTKENKNLKDVAAIETENSDLKNNIVKAS
jgi:hypothetical protein